MGEETPTPSLLSRLFIIYTQEYESLFFILLSTIIYFLVT
jgi:hypothetical protein